MTVAVLSNANETVGETVGLDHTGPGVGVIVLTASIQLRYQNQHARELCEEIIRYENVKTASGVLPAAVMSLANEIRRLLQTRTESKDWEQIQVRRVAGIPDHPVLLCGFGLLDAEMSKSRVVIVMQETGPAFWYKRVLDKSKEKFQLTLRETEILQHLLKGWTNKEIAFALGVSEQTVKEHMKHLMCKAGVTTRTGIVMKAVLCGVQYETETYASESSEFPRATSGPLFDSQPYHPQLDEPSRPTLPRNGRELMSSSNQTPYAGATSQWYQNG